MAITPQAGYIVDPNNPNAVVKPTDINPKTGYAYAVPTATYAGGGFAGTDKPGGLHIPTTITASSLSPAPTLPPVPPPVRDTTNYGAIVSGAQAYTTPSGAKVDANGNVISAPTTTPATPYTDQSLGIMDRVKSLIGMTGDKAMYEQQQLQASGALELEKKQNQLTAQINALAAESQGLRNQAVPGGAIENKMQLDAVGRGITQGGLAPLTADELRKNQIQQAGLASQALTLQAQYALNSGDLLNAQNVAKRAVALKYTPIETELTQQIKLLELYKPFMTEEQKQIADAKTLEIESKKTELADKKKLQQDVVNIAQTAAANGVAGASQLAAQAMQLDPSSSTFISDLARIQSQIPLTPRTPNSSTPPRPGVISPTTQAIINNPSLFDDLTPTERGKVVTELQANGFDTTNLGVKGLSDTAIKEIAQTQKALSDLDELKIIIQGNENMLGPITGLQRFNPYSPAKKIQADVDRVRQTVGKALEGGVLRKEDEDKYKKILATLADTPETAIYKIDALIGSIQRDIENYKSLQQSSGRSLNVGASLQKKGTVTKPEDLRTKYNY